MSSPASTAVESHHVTPQYDEESIAGFGMKTFLCSEAMLFSGLIATYIVLRMSQAGVWVPPGVAELNVVLTSWNTFFLLSSSVTFHMAEMELKQDKKPLGWLFATIVLGATFVGLQGKEWFALYNEHLWFTSGLNYSSCFFVLTGFHGFHVFIGVCLLSFTWIRTALGHFSAHKHAFFGNVGLYWHFVDVVWVALYTIVYFEFPWKIAKWVTLHIFGF